MALNSQWIALRNQGQEVPINVQLQGTGNNKKFGPGSYIEFYGQPIDSLYTDRNIYTLGINKSGGLRSDVDNSAIPEFS